MITPVRLSACHAPKQAAAALWSVLALAAAAPCSGADAPAVGAERWADRAPFILAGVLPCDRSVLDRWYWSGAWIYPVGDPHRLPGGGVDGGVPFRVGRGPEFRADGSPAHQGADLVNQRAGDLVRAAANGLVVCAARKETGGYGVHVVLAHRLEDGRLAYSVYAHLAAGTVSVREGEPIPAGFTVGRVGRTGRATTDHLHFEIRISDDPSLRWEKTRAVDPLAFVAERLPHPDGPDWSQPYLEWAACSALMAPQAQGQEPLQRGLWWRMLAHAGRLPTIDIPREPDSLRSSLVGAHLLERGTGAASAEPAAWRELARDADRLRKVGLRLPPCPVPSEGHRRACKTRLGLESPARKLKRLPTLESGFPTVLDACLILADLRTR